MFENVDTQTDASTDAYKLTLLAFDSGELKYRIKRQNNYMTRSHSSKCKASSRL